MRLHRSFVALLLGLPMAAPIAVAAEDAPLASEVQRRVAVVVLARRIRGYAAMAKASSDFQLEKGLRGGTVRVLAFVSSVNKNRP